MKAFAEWVMKGRMQAVMATTVLAVLALVITPLALASAAVVTLTVLRQGWREGAVVVVSATLAIAGLGGLLFQMPVAIALIGLMIWLPAAVLGGVMGQTGSLRLAIEAAAVGAAAIVALQYLLMQDPAVFWRDMLNEFVVQRLDSEAQAAANLGQLIELMSGWMAGGMAATWFLGSVLSLCLARHWAAMIDRPGAFGEEFRQLRFGRWLLWLVPVLLVGGVMLSGGKPNLLAQFYLIGMMVFLIQGISVAHGLVAEFAAPVAWLVGLYLMLFLIAPQGATMVSVAGYADGWLNFRARARARRSGTGDQ